MLYINFPRAFPYFTHSCRTTPRQPSRRDAESIRIASIDVDHPLIYIMNPDSGCYNTASARSRSQPQPSSPPGSPLLTLSQLA
jgi:hypothetical protein